jgi:hypothetical protein
MITFALGFGVATLISHRRIQLAPANPPETKPANAPITFSGGEVTSAFRTHYYSSDAQFLRYGCYEHGSTADAERYLHEEIRPNYKYIRSPDGRQTEVRVVEHTVTYDGKGHKTGERVVLDDGELLWTEGSRFHLIYTPSVKYALLFENARLWAQEDQYHCWNVAKLKQSF